uniref:Uncharacterized protein n=1 Tax=Anguilla anguilla TaxID=7936 RepID=A0A0E9U844_ANGAN
MYSRRDRTRKRNCVTSQEKQNTKPNEKKQTGKVAS